MVTNEKLTFPKLAIYRESTDFIIHNYHLNSWVVFNELEYSLASQLIYGNKSPESLVKDGFEIKLINRVVGMLLLYRIGYISKLPIEYSIREKINIESLEGMKPSIVYFVTTYKCNLNCIYCYAESSPKRSMVGDLSTQEAKNMIEQIKELGVKTIVFTGGEAFLRKDILELMEYSKIVGLRVNIITNGSFIYNKEKAQKIADLTELVTISLDSLDSNEHEMNRGIGTWKKTMNAIKLLLEVGCKLKINQTLTTNNLESPEAMLEFVKRNRIDLKIIPIASLGRGKDTSESYSLNYIQRKRVEDKLLQLFTEDKHEQGNSIKQFESKKHCGHGSGEFSIDSKGNVYLCKLMHDPSLLAGNIRTKKLKEIYYESNVFKEARNRTVYSLSACKSCTFKQFCAGACRAVQWSDTGDINGINIFECTFIRRSFRKQMWKYFRKKGKKEQQLV